MDGTILGDAESEQFEVETADRARWLYIRTDRRLGAKVIYTCQGRR